MDYQSMLCVSFKKEYTNSRYHHKYGILRMEGYLKCK